MDISNIIRDITKQRVLIYACKIPKVTLSLVISLIKENYALFFFLFLFLRNKHTHTKEREMSSKKKKKPSLSMDHRIQNHYY